MKQKNQDKNTKVQANNMKCVRQKYKLNIHYNKVKKHPYECSCENGTCDIVYP
jgi:hypothetical protein